MNSILMTLLADKLMDDFYDQHLQNEQPEPQTGENLTERLKALLPMNEHPLLLRWEAQCAERCGQELRQFANFIAAILLTNFCSQEDEGGLSR